MSERVQLTQSPYSRNTLSLQFSPKMTTQLTKTSKLLFLFLSLLSLTPIITSFSPIDHYLVDCGSTSPTTVDADHRRFTGDSSNSGSDFLFSTGTLLVTDSNPDPNLSPIYHTARVFTRPSKYVFDVKDKGTHLIRIHFGKFNSSNFGCSSVKFHVLVDGYVLLYDFSGDNMQNPKIKDYMIWVDDDKVVLSFVPAKKSSIGFVSAIEVISAPKDLIADVGTYVNSKGTEQVNGLMKNALETVYRVNVGGYKVTPFNDSLWRTWVTDDDFLKSSNGLTKVHFSGRVKYEKGGASREVGPDNVYNTARVITSVSDSVPRLNMTWVFSVSEGYKYLIRMHFCDIASISVGMLYFNVYVNGNLAYENLDLSLITNSRLASPFYADFVVDGDSSRFVTISVGPSSMSRPQAVDAILNGVEILKMNNSVGSLDGSVSATSVMKCKPSRDVGVWASVVAAIILFLLAPVVVQKRRSQVKGSVAWSPLPVDEVNLKQINQGSVV